MTCIFKNISTNKPENVFLAINIKQTKKPWSQDENHLSTACFVETGS